MQHMYSRSGQCSHPRIVKRFKKVIDQLSRATVASLGQLPTSLGGRNRMVRATDMTKKIKQKKNRKKTEKKQLYDYIGGFFLRRMLLSCASLDSAH